MADRIFVTSPLMPDFNEYTRLIRELWDSRMLTNNGTFVRQLEDAIASYLGEKYVSVYANGTLPLMASIRALGLSGEVITTPFTFVATCHSLLWCGLQPMFADVDPDTGDLDPTAVEAAVTPRTCAILAVHVYGRPCRTAEIAEVASRHNLKVIYDAAHAFGVRRGDRSITSEGDLATLSFHATKVFNTVEGGAVVSRDARMKSEIDKLRNFGFESETSVKAVGINAKMDEFRAIFGLLNLRKVDDAIARRKEIAAIYAERLADCGMLLLPSTDNDVKWNYSHYPVLVTEMMRDKLYDRLRASGIIARRYFYPLVTHFAPYCYAPGADNTPVAESLSRRVLCLPLHTAMSNDDAERIIGIIRSL